MKSKAKTTPNASRKRSDRVEAACSRCHDSKIKCSGQQPCTACQKANVSDECEITFRNTNVTISKRDLRQLERDSEELKRRRLSTITAESSQNGHNSSSQEEADLSADHDVANPLHENQNGHFSGQRFSSEPVFVGEGACTAFGDRSLQCVDSRFNSTSSNTIRYHMQHPILNRLFNHQPQLPNQHNAALIVEKAANFLKGYHIVLLGQFLRQLNEAHTTGQPCSLWWTCQLYALLAIGEMYSHCSDAAPKGGGVPGSDFFLQAVSLLQDGYEEPSIEQVQSLMLLSFYSNAVGRIKTAHVYGGIAIRLAIGLGLHRSQSGMSAMNPVQRENRRRVWWTLYLFDRLTASKLGYPLAIQDNDIDVELPSTDGLSEDEKKDFAASEHLCANIQLAKITGSILNDVNCLPRRHTRPFMERVRQTLNELKRWEAQLPENLSLQQDHPYRGIYSLHMLYLLCIIQTTRPVLLLIFRARVEASRGAANEKHQAFTPDALTLAESCFKAAWRLNQILKKLYLDGTLAVFGFFDTHYLFSSTWILLLVVTLDHSAQMATAVENGLCLLRKMAGSGNVAADDYLRRLEHAQATFGSCMLVPGAEHDGDGGMGSGGGSSSSNSKNNVNGNGNGSSGGASGNNGGYKAAAEPVPSVGIASPPTDAPPQVWVNNMVFVDPAVLNQGIGGDDALDDPGMRSFLEGPFEWPVGALPEDQGLGQFPYDNWDDPANIGLFGTH